MMNAAMILMMMNSSSAYDYASSIDEEDLLEHCKGLEAVDEDPDCVDLAERIKQNE